MNRVSKVLRKHLLLVALIALTFSLTAERAQAAGIAVNGGTLNWTSALNSVMQCGGPGVQPKSYQQILYYSYTYTIGGTTYQLGGNETYTISSPGPSWAPSCPAQGANPSVLVLTYSAPTGVCTIDVYPGYPTSTATFKGCVAPVQTYPGLLYPKYVIVGVTYAPPGPNSFVQYTGTTQIGNTQTFTNSFSNKATFSVSITTGAGIPGFGPSGSVSGTTSTEYIQGSNSSTSTTLSKSTSLSYKSMGTGNAFSPVNSDYDVIWLWLNPVLQMTLTPPSATNTNVGIQWNGYGYDVTDPSGTAQPDVFPVLVGWLNGHFGDNPSIDTILARSWQSSTNGYIWPAGEGPGITSADKATIVAADPLTNSNYTLLDRYPTTTTDGRFTLIPTSDPSDPNAVPYEQAGPGNGGGLTAVYNATQSNTQSVAQGTNTSSTQTYSVQAVFGASAIWSDVKVTMMDSTTLNFNNSWLSTLTTTTTLANALSITGPGCGTPTPPATGCSTYYSGPGQFLVYMDNQYGTFMFYPAN